MKKFSVVIMIFIIFFEICLGCIFYENVLKRKCYTETYFEELGIGNYNYYTYKEMLNDFGIPQSVIVRDDLVTKAVYDDFTLSFWTNSEDATLMNALITTPKYRFGYRSIGVGSSKKDVFKAYARAERSPDKGYIWRDGDAFVEFEFEKDIVKTIRIFYGV